MRYHKCFEDQDSAIENNNKLIKKIKISDYRSVLKLLTYVEHDACNCNCNKVINTAFNRIEIIKNKKQ